MSKFTDREFGGCDLHLPHKRWSGDAQEEQNYEAIEQWARRLPQCVQMVQEPAPGLEVAGRSGSVPGPIHRAHYYGSVHHDGVGVVKYVDFNTLTFDTSMGLGNAINPSMGSSLDVDVAGYWMWCGSVSFQGPPLGADRPKSGVRVEPWGPTGPIRDWQERNSYYNASPLYGIGGATYMRGGGGVVLSLLWEGIGGGGPPTDIAVGFWMSVWKVP